LISLARRPEFATIGAMRVALVVCLLAVQARADGIRRLDPDAGGPAGKVIMARAKDFRMCWQRELDKNPAAAKGGKVVIAVALDKEGAVAMAKVKSTTMNYKPTEDCLVKVMKELKFPSEAPRTFDFPFVFSQGG
jgi:hypothetical protein